MENGKITPEQVQDPQGKRLGVERTRDVCRTPMLWEAGPGAGFTTGDPWLPIAADYASRNVAAQSEDDHSILRFYRQLIWFRKRTPALLAGSYRSLETGNADCFAFTRSHPMGDFLVALNFSGREQRVQLDQTAKGPIMLSTHPDRQANASAGSLILRPDEGLLIALPA
jgi:alpha-glucosidase